MKSSSRAQLQAAGAIVLIAVCVGVILYYFWQIHGIVFEIFALTALFIAFRATPSVAHWLAGLSLIHRAIFYLLLAAVVVGHFTSNTRTYYPFVAWDIFSAVSNQETVVEPELVGTTADGKSVRLLVEQLFPSIVQFNLPKNDPVRMNQLVAALAKAYNARHAADPVREVDLMLLAVKLHPPPGQSHSQPSCELLQRYDIPTAPSS